MRRSTRRGRTTNRRSPPGRVLTTSRTMSTRGRRRRRESNDFGRWLAVRLDFPVLERRRLLTQPLHLLTEGLQGHVEARDDEDAQERGGDHAAEHCRDDGPPGGGPPPRADSQC